MLDEAEISQVIIESFSQKLIAHLRNDVVIVGGGPSGLVLGERLARAGFRTALFESRLATGGGVWGGGMLMNQIVLQEEGMAIAREYGIRGTEHRPGYWAVDAVAMTAKLTAAAVDAGLVIFNGIEAEDVAVKNDRVDGIVINWSLVRTSTLPVDPLLVQSRITVDSTGHPSAVVNMLASRGIIPPARGEAPMNCEAGERMTVEHTGCVYPGLYVTGMAACGYHGSSRMGPIFGGMLLSGVKAAEAITRELRP
jgi:sulfide-dependent adenosine diphosphate thiazole synthase